MTSLNLSTGEQNMEVSFQCGSGTNQRDPLAEKDLNAIKTEILSNGNVLTQTWSQLYSLLGIYESRLNAWECDIIKSEFEKREPIDHSSDNHEKRYTLLQSQLAAKERLLKRTQEELFQERKRGQSVKNRVLALQTENYKIRGLLSQKNSAITRLQKQLTLRIRRSEESTIEQSSLNVSHSSEDSRSDSPAHLLSEETSVEDVVRPIINSRAYDMSINSAKLKAESSYLDAPTNSQAISDMALLYSGLEEGSVQRIASAYQSGLLDPGERDGLGEPVFCPTCGAEFAKRAHLNKHMFVHEDTSKCSHCGRLVRDMAKHMANVHSLAKLHNCRVCGKGYADAQSLKTHLRNHTGEKPFSCEQCGKRFTAKIYLRVHERTHSGELRYFCTECGVRFAQRSQLTKHHSKYHRNDVNQFGLPPPTQ